MTKRPATAISAVLLASLTFATPGHAADKAADACPEGSVEISGTIGLNRLFEAPEYWVDQSQPCRVHVIELAAADTACEKGAKFSAKGTVEHVRNDGELSLVRLGKIEKASCTK